MNKSVYIIAGKIEGFSYHDAKIVGCDGDHSAEAIINALRSEGYRIFIITQEIARIDDFAGGRRCADE